MSEVSDIVLEMIDVDAQVGSAVLLSDVSISIRVGEFVTIIGRNGAGKSSLLKSCFRAIEILSGEVRLLGIPLKQLSQGQIAQSIAYVPQALDIAAPLSVGEFVRISCYPYSSANRRRITDAAILAALDRLKISKYFARQLSSLSGGERQLVLLSAALVGRPAIVLLDEPTTHLDPAAQAELFEVLSTLRSEIKCAIVMISHHLSAAKRVSDRIIAMSQGRVVGSGDPEEMLAPEMLKAVFGCRFEGMYPLVTC